MVPKLINVANILFSSFGLQAIPDTQIVSHNMVENNTISVNILFTIHGRGAMKGLDQSPNFIELVLINNLDEFVLPVEIPIDILFTENGRIGIYSVL